MLHRKPHCIFAFSFLLALTLAPRPVLAAVTITIVNLDGAGEGFNDAAAADPDSTAGGNSGATLGAQRLAAFQFAADIWSAQLDGSIEIRIGARMDPQLCNAMSAVLGSAGPTTAARDFTGALVPNTWYAIALANQLAGSDLAPGSDDIGATFNSAIGTTCPFPNVWYYGLDGNPPGSKIDFVSVVLHEIGHGLGFLTFVDLNTGQKLAGFDDTYMLNLEDHSTGKLYPNMSNAERVTASTDSGDLHWVGVNVVSGGIGLASGRDPLSGHVEMYAPSP
ncbi:MAG: peptidase, partial [Acidobacteria bacterium]|nr:peptidase [Acidobacteriota bacterium]